MRFTIIILLSFLSFSAANSQSDFDSLLFTAPVINVSSSRLGLSKEDSFYPFQRFDRQEILNTNGSRVSDVLQRACNVFIKSYGGLSSLKTVSVNGMNAEHTLILLNGTRLNTIQNSQFDLSLISNEDIESIEVIPSGSSSYFGSDALSGVVNISTFGNSFDTSADRIRAVFTARAGSYNYRNAIASVKYNSGNHDFKTAFDFEKTDDDFDYYYFNGYRNILKHRDNNSLERKNILVQYSYGSRNDVMNFMTLYSAVNRQIPGLEIGSAPMNAFQKDKIWNNILNYEHTSHSGSVLRASVNFQNYLMNYLSLPFDDSYYKNLTSGISLSYQFKMADIKYLAGADLFTGSIQSNELEEGRKRFSTAIFANIDYRTAENLRIYPSLRFENISDIGKNVVTGKLGLNYKPLGSDLFILKAGTGNSYRAPTFNELYWKTGGNGSLKPETSFNIDAGVLSEFRFFGNASVEINYSRVRADNKIVWRPSASVYWTPVNISSSSSDVISAAISHNSRITKETDISLKANYTHTSSIKTSSDFTGDPSLNKQLIFVPSDMFKIDAGIAYRKSGLNLFFSYTGTRYADYENTIKMKPALTLDGNIFTNINAGAFKFRAAFEINNITNSDYQIVYGYPMPLRNYKFTITLTY